MLHFYGTGALTDAKCIGDRDAMSEGVDGAEAFLYGVSLACACHRSPV